MNSSPNKRRVALLRTGEWGAREAVTAQQYARIVSYPVITLLAVFLFCGALFGQGSAIPGATAIKGPGNLLRALPLAPVVVCNYPASGGTPCTNYAATYTNPLLITPCPSSTPVVTPATSTCSATSDSQGNFVFFVAPGANFAYYFQSGNTWFGPYIATSNGTVNLALSLASPPPIGITTPNLGFFSGMTITAAGGISAILFNGPDTFALCNSAGLDQLSDVVDPATSSSSLAWNPNCLLNQRVFTTAFQTNPYLQGNIWSYDATVGLPRVVQNTTIDPGTGNFKLTGCTAGQVLLADGTGCTTVNAVPTGVPLGSQFVSNGASVPGVYQTKPVKDVRDYGVAGSFLGTGTTTTGTNAPGTTITVTSCTGFPAGAGVNIAGAGAAGVIYVGTITSCSGTNLVVSPATSTSVGAATAVFVDDTVATQAAITAACNTSGRGSTLILPSGANIILTSTLTVTKCSGITIDGSSSQGSDTIAAAGGAGAGNAAFMWYGAIGGTVIQINQTRDSAFKNFTVFTNATNYHNAAGANIGILIDEISSVTKIVTNNEFYGINIYNGNAVNSSFIGIDVCPTAPGNCEQQNFTRTVIQCGGGTATVNNLGTGFQYGPGGQPFDEHVRGINTTNCSRGIDVEAGFNIELDGGDTSNNYTDLYAGAGLGLTYKNFRSEQPTVATNATIVIGASLIDIEIANDSFAGLNSGNCTITYTAGTNPGKLTLLNNVWDNIAVTPICGLSLGTNSAWLTSKNNVFPVGTTCPFYSNFQNAVQSMDNCRALDIAALNFENFYNRPVYLNGVPFTQNSTPAPSPALVFNASANATDDDGIYLRNIVWATGNKSHLIISHAVTAGSAPASGLVPLPIYGGISLSALGLPIISAISVLGTPGSTSYSYEIVANDSAGGKAASAVLTKTTGNATLSGGNCLQLSWSERSGALSYTIYRTASAGTPSSVGVIGTVYPGVSIQSIGTYVFSDCGIAGDTTTAPTASSNTTGQLVVPTSTAVANLTAANHPTIDDCGSTTTCALTQKTGAIIVMGRVSFPTATTVTVTSLPYSSATSYVCMAQDVTTAAGIVNATTYTNGASVIFTETSGTNTDAMRYTCTGF
jgi:hypothetical protein